MMPRSSRQPVPGNADCDVAACHCLLTARCGHHASPGRGTRALTIRGDVDHSGDPVIAAITNLTRRRLLGSFLATAVLLGLGACGDDDDGHGAGPSASPSSTGTRTIDTAKGKVDVPVAPKRVVAIQPSASATLYDLGMTPIGVYDQGADYISPRYLAKWQAAQKIGTAGEIDVEKVAALKPDLIIGVDYEWNTKSYEQLKAIAPTVIAPADSWQVIARTVADAVNDLAGLEKLKKQVAARSAQIKADYADVLGRYKWDILQGGFDQGQFWVYGPESDAGTILAGAGVQFASASAGTPGNGNQPFSYERVDVLADAGVIGYYANYDGTPNNEGPALFAQATFKSLPAVTAEHLAPLPDFLPGGYGDALALLDELEDGLKKLRGTGS